MARTRMAMLRGRVAVPGFGDVKPLDLMEMSGVGERFNGKTLITGICHRVDEQGWQTDIQFGLSPERFAERPNIIDAPAGGLLPAVNGLQIGVIDKFEADPTQRISRQSHSTRALMTKKAQSGRGWPPPMQAKTVAICSGQNLATK